jgi:hypothetical protein
MRFLSFSTKAKYWKCSNVGEFRSIYYIHTTNIFNFECMISFPRKGRFPMSKWPWQTLLTPASRMSSKSYFIYPPNSPRMAIIPV